MELSDNDVERLKDLLETLEDAADSHESINLNCLAAHAKELRTILRSEVSRGFHVVVGKTINDVDASCINEVVLICTDGTRICINADTDGPYGLPLIRCFVDPGLN